jgi:hypothetical protein
MTNDAQIRAELRDLKQTFEQRKAFRDEQDSVIAANHAKLAEISRAVEARLANLEGSRERSAAELREYADHVAAELKELSKQVNSPLDWGKIWVLVLASAGSVAALGQYALGNLERRVESDERVIIKMGEKVDKLQIDVAAGQVTQQRNTDIIKAMEGRLGQLQVDSAATAARLTEQHDDQDRRIEDVDKLGSRKWIKGKE